jgi:Oxidoreductase family, C-terminal alpha/beta domain
MVHKPLANRLSEVRKVIDTARQTGVTTHFIPWDSNGSMEFVKAWIDSGTIGTLREVHNWTNRPFWPQYDTIPTDTPPVPPDFDWDLWLGPEQSRPYHPKYTHMVFRGWYDFGGGSMADMGHYSLWSVFRALDLGAPLSAEPILSHACAITDGVSKTIRNDFSFPAASIVRFKVAQQGGRSPIDLFWYDGGMRPPTPDELDEDRALPAEGFLFVGDKGRIVSGFRLNDAQLIPAKKWAEFQGPKPPPPAPPDAGRGPSGRTNRGVADFVAACRGRSQTEASFLNAGPLSETINLGAVALRAGSKVVFDSAALQITNHADANRYLTRDYRKGWEL